MKGNLIKGYRNQHEVSKTLNIEKSKTFMSNFSVAISGDRQSWRGFMWRKKKEFEDYSLKIPSYIHGTDNKVVYQYDKKFNLIKIYPNIDEIKPLVNKKELKEIRRVLNKQKQTYGGYIWSFSLIKESEFKNFVFTKLNTKILSNI
jgi:hypothetical protein